MKLSDDGNKKCCGNCTFFFLRQEEGKPQKPECRIRAPRVTAFPYAIPQSKVLSSQPGVAIGVFEHTSFPQVTFDTFCGEYEPA